MIFNVKIGSYLCDHLVNFCVAWGGKNAVVHKDDDDYFVLIDHSVVHPGLPKSYLLYSLGDALVLHPILLLIPIEILDNLEDVCCPDSALGFDTLGNLHVHVELNVGLKKGQYKVHLECTPSVYD